MKKIISILSLLLLININTKACEICGCGTGNYHIGLLPNFKHRFFGLRYNFQNFKTVLHNDASQFSHDNYTSIEFWTAWNIGKKWQVIAVLPFNIVHQISDDGIVNNNGVGDVAVIGNYKLWQKATVKNNKLISQKLTMGAGIKLPTGKFNVDVLANDVISKSNIQTGSASADFIFNANYNIVIDRFGVNTSASYKINAANKYEYAFGNKFSSSIIGFYSIEKAKINFLPNVGLQFENSEANKLKSEKIEQTGGYLFSTSIGTEVSYKKITIGTNVQLPLTQKFSERQTVSQIKGMVHVSYSF